VQSSVQAAPVAHAGDVALPGRSGCAAPRRGWSLTWGRRRTPLSPMRGAVAEAGVAVSDGTIRCGDRPRCPRCAKANGGGGQRSPTWVRMGAVRTGAAALYGRDPGPGPWAGGAAGAPGRPGATSAASPAALPGGAAPPSPPRAAPPGPHRSGGSPRRPPPPRPRRSPRCTAPPPPPAPPDPMPLPVHISWAAPYGRPVTPDRPAGPAATGGGSHHPRGPGAGRGRRRGVTAPLDAEGGGHGGDRRTTGRKISPLRREHGGGRRR
jgi:hypothetical protein